MFAEQRIVVRNYFDEMLLSKTCFPPALRYARFPKTLKQWGQLKQPPRLVFRTSKQESCTNTDAYSPELLVHFLLRCSDEPFDLLLPNVCGVVGKQQLRDMAKNGGELALRILLALWGQRRIVESQFDSAFESRLHESVGQSFLVLLFLETILRRRCFSHFEVRVVDVVWCVRRSAHRLRMMEPVWRKREGKLVKFSTSTVIFTFQQTSFLWEKQTRMLAIKKVRNRHINNAKNSWTSRCNATKKWHN